MVEVHIGNKLVIVIFMILGVVFTVIGVAALIPGAVFYTRPSEDPEDKTNLTIGFTFLLLGGIFGIIGIFFLLGPITFFCCCLAYCPKELAKYPHSYHLVFMRTPDNGCKPTCVRRV